MIAQWPRGENNSAADRIGFVPRKVRVNLLPRFEKVRMSVATAQHLYRLLDAYNHVALGGESYSTRWALFWPLLDRIERKALVLLLMTNGVKAIGTPLLSINTPAGVDVGGVRTIWNLLPVGVKSELRAAVALHQNRLVSKSDVVALWAERCPSELAWLRAHGVLDAVLDPVFGFHSDLVAEAVAVTMIEAGESRAASEAAAGALALELDELLLFREEAFWDSLDKG